MLLIMFVIILIVVVLPIVEALCAAIAMTHEIHDIVRQRNVIAPSRTRIFLRCLFSNRR